MSNLNKVKESIKLQWEEMLNRGITPVIEYQTSEDDWLTVNITFHDDCFLFSFDKEMLFDTSFSGEVEKVANNHQINIDEYTDNLDLYLQMIDSEILEGYLLPNGLYYCEY